jgi:hypothetical protein
VRLGHRKRLVQQEADHVGVAVRRAAAHRQGGLLRRRQPSRAAATGKSALLDAAHQRLGGPLILVWDYLNTHVSRAMRELAVARDWLTVFQLPPYASELNLAEGVWSVLKRALANLAKQDLDELTALARTRLRRMQYRPGLLTGFLAGTRLDLTSLQ